MLSTHKHEQKIIDPAPVNKNECARCSGPNCWKRWPGTPSWRSWRRPNDSPSGEKHIRRAKGEEGKGCTIRQIARLLQLAKGVETVAALLEVSNFYILQEAIIKMVSQANVDRPIIGFLSEGLLLLFSHGSNLSRSRHSKNNERDSRIYSPLARAGTWKIPNNLHYNSWRWRQSFFALNISVGVRQFP